MGLRGQADRRGELGYAMAALLVMMAVMAVLMTVAMPVWRHEAQREKEEEAIWRGTQIARAIALYFQKTRAFPTSIDVLVEGRYLRKKYKDPLTKDGEWQLIPAGATNQQQPGTPVGGFGGVTSKSQETSIRTYRGATRYNQWQFTWQNTNIGRGGGPGRGGPGGAGGPGGPGGQGNPARPGGGRNPSPTNPGGQPTNPFPPGRGPGPGRGFDQPGTNQPPFGRGPARGGREF
jgi:type II secretory pathway pseudopilin PulG